MDASLLDNVINFFSEMNNMKRKISIILIANNNLHNLNLTGFRYLDIIIIKKPFYFIDLKKRIDKLSNSKENDYQDINLKIINLEKTDKTKQIYDAIIKIVRNNLNVLISGESGTGKNYIALAINDLISKNKILEIDHTDYINNTIDELLSNKINFEKFLETKSIKNNNFDCILFQDIDAMPIKTQLLLLNAFKKKGNRSNNIFKKKRIISTTTKNIKNILRNNNFSNELFYELDMYNIFTIPLRERPEDIKQLIKSFIFDLNSYYNRNRELSLDSYIKMSSYMWPGNIKQLKNFITRVYKLTKSNLIEHDIVISELSNEFSYDEQNYIDN